MFSGIVLYVILCLNVVLSDDIILQNKFISLTFDSNSFSLTALSLPKGKNLIQPLPSIWTLQLVYDGGQNPVFINGTSNSEGRSFHKTNTAVNFTWSDILVGPKLFADVWLSASLPSTDEGKVEFSFDFSVPKSYPHVSLWEWQINVGNIGINSQHVIIQNMGFGVLNLCENGCFSFDHAYPQSTFQFMGTYDTTGSLPSIYIAAHDPLGESKEFGCGTTGPAGSQFANFKISAQPPGAGFPIKSYTIPYPIVVSLYKGDWWDASQIYRQWALSSALWVKKGPISGRSDVPSWVLDVTTWVNSHWQELDIFNTTGGDPEVVLNRVSNIVKLFGIKGGLGLHWYEWDTLGYELGSNYTKCMTEVTCGFDTHYPEYYPVRTEFENSVKKLQSLGVRVAPYINGRIFDQATATWTHDGAKKWMAKKANAQFAPTQLSLYEEEYGSLAKFAVSCPYTAYWQDVISQVVSTLIGNYSTDGVYIDQIAAAGPRNCWDPTHQHPPGGGDTWVSGYRSLLETTRKLVGNNALILTESNAESYMDSINIYLSLVAYSIGDFDGPMKIAPIFPAIYGGYYISMGAIFFRDDLIKNPDVFCAKIAKQFLYGTQLGWFSLGGRDNQNPYMGLYESMMDVRWKPEISFLRLLSEAKQVANNWFQFGRAMRDIPLKVNGTEVSRARLIRAENSRANATHKGATPMDLIFAPVMSVSWMSAKNDSLIISIVTVENDAPATVEFQISMEQYGFPNSSEQMFNLVIIYPPPSLPYGSFKGCCVTFKQSMKARDVIVLQLSKEN